MHLKFDFWYSSIQFCDINPYIGLDISKYPTLLKESSVLKTKKL